MSKVEKQTLTQPIIITYGITRVQPQGENSGFAIIEIHTQGTKVITTKVSDYHDANIIKDMFKVIVAKQIFQQMPFIKDATHTAWNADKNHHEILPCK